jgi:chitin disaccharide deacetylase
VYPVLRIRARTARSGSDSCANAASETDQPGLDRNLAPRLGSGHPLAPRSPPLLIVNADDLGMSPGINRGIFAGHETGIVTSASLLVTGTSFDEAIAGLAEHPRLGVGVHLCLHEERPVLPPERIQSLVGADGRLLPRSLVLRRAVLGKVAADEVEAELAAQVSRALGAGVAVDHLDSHCNLHEFPPIARVVRRVAERFGIRRVRRAEARRWSDFAGAPAGRFAVSAAVTVCTRISHRALGPTVRTTDRFLGLVHSGSGKPDWIEKAIRTLEPGTSAELAVHPSDGSDPVGPSDDHGPAKRQKELAVLTSTEVKEAVLDSGVELIPWSALPA